MNNIDAMRARIEHLEAERETLLAGFKSLMDYAVSEKFWRDPYIHNADITTRINEVLSEWTDVNLLPYGAGCLLNYASEVRARGFINVVSPGDGRWGEYRDTFRRSHPETFAETGVSATTPCGHETVTLSAPAHEQVRCGSCQYEWKADVSIGGIVAWRALA